MWSRCRSITIEYLSQTAMPASERPTFSKCIQAPISVASCGMPSGCTGFPRSVVGSGVPYGDRRPSIIAAGSASRRSKPCFRTLYVRKGWLASAPDGHLRVAPASTLEKGPSAGVIPPAPRPVVFDLRESGGSAEQHDTIREIQIRESLTTKVPYKASLACRTVPCRHEPITWALI